MQPCELYFNTKPPEQQLFTAAAALFSLNGRAAYRADADRLLDPGRAFTFLFNWNNVWTQGILILATTDRADPGGVSRPQREYKERIAQGTQFWSDCSKNGQNSNFCECGPALL